MADQLQLRRGTEAQNAAFTGAQGEITVDTDNDVVVVHDGVTPGGFSTAKKGDINDTTLYFDDDTGGGSVADAYILTPKSNSRTPSSYFDGLQIGFVTANTNTGASTADFAALGVKNIKNPDGTDPDAGAIDGRVNLVYDAGNDWLELQSANISTVEQANLKSGRKNLVNNSRFQLNIGGVSGVVALLAGEPGHTGWVAGASGCTYTFSETLGVTTLTITAGTIQQAISGDRFLTGDSILSWTGTAQGRIDAGSYGDSGDITASLNGGTPSTVEFNTGTLSEVQLETGTLVTNYEVNSLQEDKVDSGFVTASAWVNFNGAGAVAIRDSYNVSSVTDNGVGDYTVNYINALANDSYCVSGMSGETSGAGVSDSNLTIARAGGYSNSVTTTFVRLQNTTLSGAAADREVNCVLVFGGV